jgi:hypothetical protein
MVGSGIQPGFYHLDPKRWMDGLNPTVHPVVPDYLAHPNPGADSTPILAHGNARLSAPPMVIIPHRPGISAGKILPGCWYSDATRRAPMVPRYQC